MNRSTQLPPWSLAFLSIILLQPLAGVSAPDADALSTHITGTVVTPDGKTVVGADVICARRESGKMNYDAPQTAKTDAKGQFDFVEATPKKAAYILLVTSPEGVAVRSWLPPSSTLTLDPFTSVRIYLVCADGKPMAGLGVSPIMFFHGQRVTFWSKQVSDDWTGVTDANGEVTLSHLPQGDSFAIDVNDVRFAHLETTITLANAPQTPNKTIQLALSGALTGSVRFSSGKPASGVGVEARQASGKYWAMTMTDAVGQYRMLRIAPGNYTVHPHLIGDKAADCAPHEAQVTVSSGRQVAAPDFSLSLGARITGTVTDKIDGKPVTGLYVNVSSVDAQAHQTGAPSDLAHTTDKDGRYSIRVAPGTWKVFSDPEGRSGVSAREITVAEGDVKTINFKVLAPTPQVSVQGIVLGPDGKPAAGASVTVSGTSQPWNVTADADGRFTLDRPDVTSTSKLYARLGDLATKTAATPAAKGDTILHLAAGAFSTISGQVVDIKHKPISNAKVMLFDMNVSGPGDKARTDSQGRYVFPHRYGDARYSIMASANGYADKNSSKRNTIGGKDLQFPPLALTSADSFIGGTVVDPSGKPVPGATVSTYQIFGLLATTDKAGRFRLNGVPGGHAVIEVRAPEGREASIEEPSGTDANVITVSSKSEEMAASHRLEAAMAVDKLKHGDGANAHALLASAERRAAASGRQVLVDFHASWCGGCTLLDAFFADPKIAPILKKHFVIQEIDVWEKGDKKKKWENPGGVDLYKKYGSQKDGVPYVVVLDKAGKVLGSSIHNCDNMGMPSEPNDVAFFLKTLKSAAPSLTAADLAALKAG